MTLKILLLFYRQTGLLYLIIHIAAGFLEARGDFNNVLVVLFFLKTGQYFSIYFYYKKFNTNRLILYMNLGVKLRSLFTWTYTLDILLLIITLIIARQ